MAAAATLGLGSAVVLGWHARLLWLVEPLVAHPPMAYNTAVCLVLSSLGLLALRRGRWWSCLPLAVIVLTAASLLEDALSLDLGIAGLLFTPLATPNTLQPGEMAPNTALAHLVAAGALFGILWWPGRRANAVAELAGWFVMGLASICLFGLAVGVEPIYHWGALASMAPSTAGGLLLLGLGVALAGSAGTGSRSWLALGVALAVVTMAAVLAQAIALAGKSPVRQEVLAIVTLAVGVSLAVLVGGTVRLWQLARDRAAALLAANGELRALAERNRLLGAAFDDVGQGIVITDPAGVILYVNPAFTTLTGYSRDEAVDQNPRLLNSGRQSAEIYRQLWATIKSGERWRGDLVNRRKGGELYLEAMEVSPVVDADGAITHFVAVKEDVTERRRAEAALLASETKFRLLFERTADALLLLDPESSRFVDCNQAAVEMLWCAERGEVCALGPIDLSPPQQPDGRKSAEKAAVMIATALELGSHRFEWVHRSAQRPDFPVDVLLTPILMGERQMIITTWRDITERRRTEDALRRLVAIIENTTDFVGQADAEGRITYVNPAGLRLVGAQHLEDVLGRPIASLHPPAAAARILEESLPTALRDGVWMGDTELLAGDGRIVSVSQVILVGRDTDGRVSHASTVMRDQTAHRALEEKLRHSQRLEAIGRLAGGIAHDFNNILGVILGYGELLLRDLGPDHPGRRRAEVIQQAAKRAATLTRQLLAFSRKQILQPKVLDLDRLVSDLGPILRRLIGEDIEIVVRPGVALGQVSADPGQVEQVLMNLVVNARDAMPSGGRLMIETRNVELDESYALAHPKSHAGPHVMLAVSDTGLGMSRETLTRIFEPFFTTKEQGKGTGLGLATVHGIVEQSGGSVEVYSEPGQGSVFKVYLPRIDLTTTVVSTAEAEDGLAPGGSEILMVVEDDEALRELVGEALTSAGYRVVMAASPAEALAASAAQTGPIHLLLTDVVMPGMSGRALAERLRESRPELPVLFMSGYTDEAIVHHGVLDAGVRFVAKPFTGQALLSQVRQALDAPK